MLSSKQLSHIALVEEKCKYEEMKHVGKNCSFQNVGWSLKLDIILTWAKIPEGGVLLKGKLS